MTRWKVLISVAIAASLASGLAVFQASRPLDFDRSPTKPIPTVAPMCINGGGTRVYRVVPPDEPMSMPRRTSLGGDDYELTWDYTGNTKHETDQPFPEIVPLDVERLELVAFGTWHPRADDPVPAPENWSRPVHLRDPQSLEVLTGTRLNELGMPGKFLSLTTDREWHEEGLPNLRLIFRFRIRAWASTWWTPGARIRSSANSSRTIPGRGRRLRGTGSARTSLCQSGTIPA